MTHYYKAFLGFLVLLLCTAGTTKAQVVQIPNPGFESWTCNSYCDPDGWGDINNLIPSFLGIATCEQGTGANAHSGTYGVQLHSQSVFGNIAPGICATGIINQNTYNIEGGFPLPQRPITLTGWYKYSPNSPDTFSVSVNVFSGNTYGTPVASANFSGQTTVSSWTQFSLDIPYSSNVSVDSANIVLLGSAGAHGRNGTLFYVDDLQMVDCSSFTASTTPTAATCTQSDGSVLLTVAGGQGPYSYAWSNGNTSSHPTNLAAGTYTVTATENHFCTVTATATVTASNTPVTMTLATVSDTCGSGAGSIAVTPTSGTSSYTYLWNNSSTGATLTGTAGTYNVTVTDAHGCSGTGSASISNVNLTVTASATPTTSSCVSNTGTVTTSVSGGAQPYSYSWSNGATSANLSNVGAGNYSVTISEAHGCSTTASASVLTASGPSATNTVTNAQCNGGTDGGVTVVVTGGTGNITYAWSNSTANQNLSNVGAGNYTLTITDANNCSFLVTAVVGEPTPITVTSVVTDVACFSEHTGSIVLTAAGGTSPYTYAWASGDGTGLAGGNYTATITDAHGCTVTRTDSVATPAEGVSGHVNTTNVACFGDSTGTVSLNVSGGTPPYNFSWNNGESTQNLTNVAAGFYQVTTSDSHGCNDVRNGTVDQPAAALAVTSTVVNATSTGAHDGSITLNTTGGTSPYTIAWSSGNGTSLAAGNYCATVTDNAGCSVTRCDSVSAPSGISAVSELSTKIYPNPASNEIIIESPYSAGKLQLTLYSVDGKLVEERIISSVKAAVSINSLASGLYSYQVKDLATGKFGYGKLQVNK